MSLNVDPVAIAEIIRDVAETVILPRYQTLSADEISEKVGGELVTIADEESELLLSQYLTAYLPGSVVLGEEGYAKDPNVIAALTGDAPVWILDPVDGTHNFAAGKRPFVVIVALCLKGETVMGWIYDPIDQRLGFAEKNAITEFNGITTQIASSKPNSELIGFCARGLIAHPFQASLDSLEKTGATLTHPFCFGHEYLQHLQGAADFSIIGRFFPWDHAAGVLMFEEAGGVAKLITGEEYRPTIEPNTNGSLMILAPDQDRWQDLKSYFN